ncbi:MAG: response regulator [Chitinophagaceae bacterium]
MEVLIVDDDVDLLEMVSLVLRRHAMTVTCLVNGSGVLESIQTKKPDIILMDIYLGDSDGRDLCRTIKSTKEFQDIPVILYSAGNIPAASIETSGANDFITKPFDISVLVNKINKEV